jgi:hypothetical protein
MQMYGSFYALMREFLPDLDWDRIDPHHPSNVNQIMAWADAYRAQHGRWPTTRSGPVAGENVTWQGINARLKQGCRGLPGGCSLIQFLERHRGASRRGQARLSEEQILVWTEAYFAAHGRWPTSRSGPITGTRETWHGVDIALSRGLRGLPGGVSLAGFVSRSHGVRSRVNLSRLTEESIVTWAQAFYDATGQWPHQRSGIISQSPGDTWTIIDVSLRDGRRGLRGGSSLSKLLKRRGLK